MEIIEEIENRYNYKIRFITKIHRAVFNKNITENDLKVINDHRFKIKRKNTIQCIKCLIEADIVTFEKSEVIVCFFENDIDSIDFKSCKELMMLRACE